MSADRGAAPSVSHEISHDAMRRIDAKRAAGQPLLPDLKASKTGE